MLNNLCDVPGVLVGHATDYDGQTGCTAILFDRPAVVAVEVRGSSPGTRETDRLAPLGIVRDTHGLLLTGGSAFGLAAADGVVRFLEEKGIGLEVGVAKIPLVSAAVIFDLMFGSPNARPDADMGYKASAAAASSDFGQGSVGAGTGATVGKMLGLENAMKGGLGSTSIELEGGLIVAALAVVNAVGDVRDERGMILAGPRGEDGKLADSVALMPQAAGHMRWGQNTTLGIVATNARLTKPEATKVAQMSHDGLARAIFPVHTSVDGDAVFVAGVGEIETAPDVVGAWGAQIMQESILRAIRAAKGTKEVPSLTEHAGEG